MPILSSRSYRARMSGAQYSHSSVPYEIMTLKCMLCPIPAYPKAGPGYDGLAKDLGFARKEKINHSKARQRNASKALYLS
jgi:hypothetical protein